MMTELPLFREDFLWGAATSAHQVEGNNTNSDLWIAEHIQPTLFVEPSLDACDHYHRFPSDIRLLADLGLNTYRFSIEWARVEPERGHFSEAALDHYRRMLEACRENGVKPMVTLYHFSSPRWFAGMGGWEARGAADLFVRYAERVARHMGDSIAVASTFNEPNMPALLEWVPKTGIPLTTLFQMRRKAAKAIGTGTFGCFFLGDPRKLEQTMIAAHHRARAAMKACPGSYPIGLNISLQDEQAVGAKSKRDTKCAKVYHAWMDAANASDFLGVQVYTRCRVGKSGDLAPEEGVELTQMGYEFWPEALETCLRYAAGRVSVPLYVTENGIATEDDSRRIEYIRRAVAGMANCVADGMDIRGYIHWTLMDNFEWIFGYRPKFGLLTRDRHIKPSAHYLGEIARSHGASLAAAVRQNRLK